MTTTLREQALAGRSLWIDLREPGSMEPDDEHCTLLFVGKLQPPRSDDTQADALLALETCERAVVALRLACEMVAYGDPGLWGAPPGPLVCRVGGQARFVGNAREGDPHVLLLQNPSIHRLRACLQHAVKTRGGPERRDDFDYTPHVTIGRVGRDDTLTLQNPIRRPFQFSDLQLCCGDAWERFPIGGAP